MYEGNITLGFFLNMIVNFRYNCVMFRKLKSSCNDLVYMESQIFLRRHKLMISDWFVNAKERYRRPFPTYYSIRMFGSTSTINEY